MTEMARTTGSEVATNTTYDLDLLRTAFEEFLLRRARIDEDELWCEEFRAQIDRISGGAEYFKLDGREVLTNKRNGNFSLKRFEQEHPDTVAQFTRLVTEMKFDRDAFREAEPTLYEQYKARVLRVSPKAKVR